MTEKSARRAILVFFGLIVLIFLIHGLLIYNIPSDVEPLSIIDVVSSDTIPVRMSDTSYPGGKLVDCVIREMTSFYLVEDAGELHLLVFRMHPYTHRYKEHEDILVPQEGSYRYRFHYSFAVTTLVITDGILEDADLGITVIGGTNTFLPLIAYSVISFMTTVIIFKISGKIKKKNKNNA